MSYETFHPTGSFMGKLMKNYCDCRFEEKVFFSIRGNLKPNILHLFISGQKNKTYKTLFK